MKFSFILQPIKESTQDYEALEQAIRDHFKKEIYLPILRELGGYKLQNSKLPSLQEALNRGIVTFNQGQFSGKFNSEIVKQLRALGATFDRFNGVYRISRSKLPVDITQAISASNARFAEKLNRIDEKLGTVFTDEVLGQGISKKLKTDHFFDRALWRVEKDFQKSVKGIAIAPQLSPEQRQRIAAEWGNNMQLWIQDFTKKEITELRQNIQQSVFSGNRYGAAVKTIEESYGVSERKAKFLARQETSLLMTKFKQTRYQASGVEYYKWGCVSGSKLHPVRPWHKELAGKIFRWDDPPVTTKPGEPQRRNNPGQDYNCRCFARPMVGYTGKIG